MRDVGDNLGQESCDANSCNIIDNIPILCERWEQQKAPGGDNQARYGTTLQPVPRTAPLYCSSLVDWKGVPVEVPPSVCTDSASNLPAQYMMIDAKPRVCTSCVNEIAPPERAGDEQYTEMWQYMMTICP